MNKEQFTPGPWVLKESPMDLAIFPADNDAFPIAKIENKYRSKKVKVANGRLIAAAHDMYEELKNAESFFRSYLETFEFTMTDEWKEDIEDRIEKIKTVINKANP